MDQLDDGMIFYLASLPAASFHLAEKIFTMYATAQLKGQKVPRSKRGVTSKPPDLKGSSFKCLRGIEFDAVYKLLQSVAAGEASLHDMASQSISIKQLGKVQLAFMKATNCSEWCEAEDRYPEFVQPEKLEVYKKLNFNKPTIPPEFMRYCQRAMKAAKHTSMEPKKITCGDDKLFSFEHEKSGARGIFWSIDVFEVNGNTLEQAFLKVRSCVQINVLQFKYKPW